MVNVRQTLCAGLVLLLAACGGRGAVVPSATRESVQVSGTAAGWSYAPSGDVDGGRFPQAALINVNGVLYGTAAQGGRYDSPSKCPNGCGVVFSMTTSGIGKMLHSFGKFHDGKYPLAPLIDVGGTFYGTTSAGGKFGGGTVFSLTADGVENVLHSFGAKGDGTDPVAGLVEVGGKLYGTTYGGGAFHNDSTCSYSSGCGTVFSITTSGVETVLHSFGHGNDGEYPEAALVHIGNTLYGTTFFGGRYLRCNHGNYTTGCGTVFRITPTGTENVLHSFARGRDGAYPAARLLPVNGALYGTTSQGGEPRGSGTVFVITTNGAEKVLYSFAQTDPLDAGLPQAGLIDVKGTLYGTTESGGGCDSGTVFSLTATGVETVLHGFCSSNTNGSTPLANLIEVNGLLYGTTAYGGGRCKMKTWHDAGCGTVFSITTGGQFKLVHRFP